MRTMTRSNGRQSRREGWSGMTAEDFTYDVVVVGGAGHVGLPLAIAFASRGLRVCIYDLNQAAVDTVLSGGLPFREDGAQEVLTDVLAQGRLTATTDSTAMGRAEH